MTAVRPGALWERMSLTVRLLVAAGAALAAGVALLLFSSIGEDARASRAGITEKLSDEIAFLVLSVSEEAVTGDYATIQQMLIQHAERADIEMAGWSGAGAQPILISGEAPLQVAPGWFARWTGLQPVETWEAIEVGGREYGRVFLRITPVPALNALWVKFQRSLQILLLGIGAVFSAIILVVTGGLKPLTQLAASAQRFGAGDHSIRIPAEGPEEIRSTVSAFNAMADSIEHLLESLQNNQAILFEEKERAQVTLESIADAVIATGIDGRVEYLNAVAAELTGWEAERARDQPLGRIFQVVSEESGAPVGDLVQAVLDGAAGEAGEAERSLLLCRGEERIAIESTASAIRNRDGGVIGAVLVFRDVSHARRMAHQLSWQASHDPLTGLVNRREFERRLSYLVESTRSEPHTHCLLYLDLDQFKIVNDTCGHVAGDELLRQVAALLHAHVRESDTLARLGGDEFGVLLEGCPLDQARTIAGKMLDELSQFRFVWQSNSFVVGASIGMVVIGHTGQGMTELLSAADAACYSAKEKGRNRVQVYLPDDTELALRHGEMQWVSRINQALESDRLRLYFQSIVPVGRRHDGGDHFEILLRMLDDRGQPVLPMAFIPAAERYNLMAALDRRVVAMALEAFGRLYTGAGSRALHCASINLSGVSLGDEHFLSYVAEQVERSGIQPSLICFEITETAAIANLSQAIAFMRRLRELGCRFALDDFGSGLSSFAYLKNLPVDYIKIDGSFIKDMEHDPIDSAIVRSITHIGHEMGLMTIAEFVDSDLVLGMLKEVGVDYAQGNRIGIPMPLETLLAAPGADGGKSGALPGVLDNVII